MAVSKEEYIKKYLSASALLTEKNKKRRKDAKSSRTSLKIVDDDSIVLSSLEVGASQTNFAKKTRSDDECEHRSDEEPVIDLTGKEADELRMAFRFKKSNWMSVSDKIIGDESNKAVDKLQRQRYDSESDQSVDRSCGSRDQSPVRRRKKLELTSPSSSKANIEHSKRGSICTDSDLSPSRAAARNTSQDKMPAGGVTTAPNRRLNHYGNRKPKEMTEQEKKRVERMKEKYEIWNKGAKQIEMRTQKLQEMAETLEKPLARYRDDADLDKQMKGRLLDEDPMLAYVLQRSKQHAPEKPKYRGQAPPNRYSILPGFRWDGLDRSNGFEKKLLAMANVKKVEQDEYYSWSSGRFE